MTHQVIEWQVITDVEALYALQPRWQTLVEQSHCENVFNSPAWILTWLEVYWQSHWQLYSLAGYEGDTLVAFLPLYIQPSRNIYQLSHALPLGSGEKEIAEIASEYIDCLVHPKYIDKTRKKLTVFIDDLPIDCLSWRAALNDQVISRFIGYKRASGNLGRYIVSTENWDKARLSANNQKKIARLSNKIDKAAGHFSWVSPNEYHLYWDKLASFHQDRWQNKGHMGAFFAADFHQFHNTFRDKFDLVKMSCLKLGEEIVAVHYYFSANNTLYFYQSGWQQDQYSAFSPSYMLHLWTIQHCEEDSYDFMMAGKDSSYKNQFLGEFQPMQNIQIIKSKKKAFVVKMLNKLRHKITKLK